MKLFLNAKGWVKVVVVLCLTCNFMHSVAQNESLADSLIQVYESKDYDPALKLKILSDIAVYLPDPDRILMYSDTLMDEAVRLDSTRYIFNANLQKGNALQQKGDLSEALESYFSAVEITNTN